MEDNIAFNAVFSLKSTKMRNKESKSILFTGLDLKQDWAETSKNHSIPRIGSFFHSARANFSFIVLFLIYVILYMANAEASYLVKNLLGSPWPMHSVQYCCAWSKIGIHQWTRRCSRTPNIQTDTASFVAGQTTSGMTVLSALSASEKWRWRLWPDSLEVKTSLKISPYHCSFLVPPIAPVLSP